MVQSLPIRIVPSFGLYAIAQVNGIVAILLVLSVLFYGTKRHESEEGSLRDLWILGLFSLALYPLIDYFFEAKLGLVTYLTNDLKVVATPFYVSLYWVLGVLLFGYFYYRVRGLTNKVWIGALATGLFSAASATFVRYNRKLWIDTTIKAAYPWGE
jgi:hypothetical protein